MLLCAVLSTVFLTGCTKVDQSKAKVLDAIDRTEQLAREFAYTDSSGGHTTVVRGTIQDDLRYKLVASVDGTQAASEVVVDDARAMQVTNTALLKDLATTRGGSTVLSPASVAPTAAATPSASSSPSSSPSASPSPSSSAAPSASAAASPAPSTIAGVTAPAAPAAPAAVPAALQSGQWVLDQAGAAGLTAVSLGTQTVGKNPLLDSLTALEYVRAAVNAGQNVTKFNPESETYRPKLDPFPRPSSGVIRYDVIPPILQPRSNGAGGQTQLAVPETPFFRIMAVYIRNGMVVEAREKIDIATRLLDPQSNLQARLGDFVSLPSTASVDQQASALQTFLNQQLARTGKPLLRQRTMDLAFISLGHAASVSLPAEATAGNLSGVDAHGQLLYEQH